ncbi:MAG: prepilin-type N-terminal cleavage/methylation domain-containing protein [Lentisphaeraceae bacterium]|nr:prepilin-type N-terminal cleavage/methylation domain-containing protein [Lentisphaeraceae bacterium]
MKKFTLIELLVVISIIGILASLLMPSLAKARDKGKMAVCKSNLKQIGYGAVIYSDVNDDHFAQSTGDWLSTISNTGGKAIMMGKYAEIMDGPQALYCPSMPDRDISTGNPKNFSARENVPKFKSNQWCQAAYGYRKYADKTKYRIAEVDSSTALAADLFNDFWGERFGNILHGPKSYITLYGDSSVAVAFDSAKWAASSGYNSTNISMHADDLNMWTLILDR